jgi:hypothetical protein
MATYWEMVCAERVASRAEGLEDAQEASGLESLSVGFSTGRIGRQYVLEAFQIVTRRAEQARAGS